MKEINAYATNELISIAIKEGVPDDIIGKIINDAELEEKRVIWHKVRQELNVVYREHVCNVSDFLWPKRGRHGLDGLEKAISSWSLIPDLLKVNHDSWTVEQAKLMNRLSEGWKLTDPVHQAQEG